LRARVDSFGHRSTFGHSFRRDISDAMAILLIFIQ
jgi:hypothetical protein